MSLKRKQQVRFELTRNTDMKPASRIKVRKTCHPCRPGRHFPATDGLYLAVPASCSHIYRHFIKANDSISRAGKYIFHCTSSCGRHHL